MSASLNEATLMGFLGGDPEHRVTASGIDVSKFRLATTDVWKDKESGEKRESTEWHQITLFGKLAQVSGQFLKKGALVWVRGKLRTQEWEDDKGVKRWSTEILAGELKMLDRLGQKKSDEGKPVEAKSDGKKPAVRKKSAKAASEPVADDGFSESGEDFGNADAEFL